MQKTIDKNNAMLGGVIVATGLLFTAAVLMMLLGGNLSALLSASMP